jgi:glycosyltransferase involved in cell wall biosynthesis
MQKYNKKIELKEDLTLFEVCTLFDTLILSDFAGGSPLEKTFLMAYLIKNQNLKSFAEIGVYRGKSFFPCAYSINLNNGKSYGIDPYNLKDAMEYDLDVEIKDLVNNYLSTLDFQIIYEEVLSIKDNCDFGHSINLLRKTSQDAFVHIKKNEILLDIIHIDGNHDTRYVEYDYKNYFQILQDGGFIVFDDINWKSVSQVYLSAKDECIEVFKCDTFAILMKNSKSTLNYIKADKLSKRLYEVYDNIKSKFYEKTDLPKIGIGILTYNHINYISQCFNSIISQEGNFILEIVICDDCSSDGTSEKILDLISNVQQNEKLKITYLRNEHNIGIINNLHKLLNSLYIYDYFSICEGDDYYLSDKRTEIHLEYHKRNPQTILSFNKMLLYFQETNTNQVWEQRLTLNQINTEKLITENFIGNLGCSFYNSRIFLYIQDDLFEMFTADWMLNIFCSQYGDIGLIDEILTCYRKHAEGVWSGMNAINRFQNLIKYIDNYNKYLNFSYDKEFTLHRNKCIQKINGNLTEELDLAIIDDIFPHPLSGFRLQEFSSILENLPKSKVFTNGRSIKLLGNKTLNELLIDYKRKYPELGSQVQEINDGEDLKPKLLYCTFLGNAYEYLLPIAKKNKIPFVFTLYPGGAFGLNNKSSDLMLRRVCSSPLFKKVIVTQQITYDYLVNNNFCTKDKIEFIFGVVLPLEKLELKYPNKQNYKIDKQTLDICFVAHKYTQYGEDKGYDVFINVAKILCSKYHFLRFHVIGPFDENVLNINGIYNITFYGSQDQDWFDEFYKNIDIILSPNIDGKIFKGSFDGFPTGCLTDAALRKVSMFCTDPLNLNTNFFIDKKDIVILDYDPQKIVDKIEFYIDNPELLKEIGINGCNKVKQIYNYENQILPRIEILKNLISEHFDFHEYDLIDFQEIEIIKESKIGKLSDFVHEVGVKILPDYIYKRIYPYVKELKDKIFYSTFYQNLK